MTAFTAAPLRIDSHLRDEARLDATAGSGVRSDYVT
jgi:hypothetical protein